MYLPEIVISEYIAASKYQYMLNKSNLLFSVQKLHHEPINQKTLKFYRLNTYLLT